MRHEPPAIAALGTTLLIAAGCGGAAARGPSGDRPWILRPREASSFRFFSPRSFWNAPVRRDAALDPASADLVDALANEVGREQTAGEGPWINTIDYSVPVYRVGPDQQTVRVRLDSRFAAPALRAAWRRVPLPPRARPSAGSDRALVVWQPRADRLWEFWRLARSTKGWSAAWGGAIRDVSSNRGAYGPAAWPGANRSWGSSASSLSIAGGLIGIEDLRRGWINHALAIAVPDPRAGVFAAPAHRTDGTSSSPSSLPEGAHLRLDPKLDLASLRLPRLTRMIAVAAQRFGIFVRDRSRVVQLFAQAPGGRDPYRGGAGYFEGLSPAQLLAGFPWRRLQVLAMELRR